MIKSIFFFIFLISLIHASDVVKLNQQNFKQVLDSKLPFFVEFFAPWCGHCKSLAPTWEGVASNMKGIVPIGAVDCTVEQSLCQKYGVQGYPTLKLFKNGKPVDYQQGRDARSIIQFAVDNIENNINNVASASYDKFWEKQSTLPHVLLFSSKDKIAPMFKSIGVEFKGKLVFGQIKNTDSALCEKFGITNFPTILVLANKDAEGVKYDGEIQVDALKRFFAGQAGEEVEPEPEAAAPKKDPLIPPRKKEIKITQFTPETFLNCQKTLCAAAFIDQNEDEISASDKEILDQISEVYKTERTKLSIGWIDKQNNKDFHEKFDNAPFVIFRKSSQKYTSTEYTKDSTLTLISRTLTGDAKWTPVKE